MSCFYLHCEVGWSGGKGSGRQVDGARFNFTLIHPSLQRLWFMNTVWWLCPPQQWNSKNGSLGCPASCRIILMVTVSCLEIYFPLLSPPPAFDFPGFQFPRVPLQIWFRFKQTGIFLVLLSSSTCFWFLVNIIVSITLCMRVQGCDFNIVKEYNLSGVISFCYFMSRWQCIAEHGVRSGWSSERTQRPGYSWAGEPAGCVALPAPHHCATLLPPLSPGGGVQAKHEGPVSHHQALQAGGRERGERERECVCVCVFVCVCAR